MKQRAKRLGGSLVMLLTIIAVQAPLALAGVKDGGGGGAAGGADKIGQNLSDLIVSNVVPLVITVGGALIAFAMSRSAMQRAAVVVTALLVGGAFLMAPDSVQSLMQDFYHQVL